jgi:hypothetical protein
MMPSWQLCESRVSLRILEVLQHIIVLSLFFLLDESIQCNDEYVAPVNIYCELEGLF